MMIWRILVNGLLPDSSQILSFGIGGIKKKTLHLSPNRFRFSHSGRRIKRESGVNPEQSRCCEAPFQHPETTIATGLL